MSEYNPFLRDLDTADMWPHTPDYNRGYEVGYAEAEATQAALVAAATAILADVRLAYRDGRCLHIVPKARLDALREALTNGGEHER